MEEHAARSTQQAEDQAAAEPVPRRSTAVEEDLDSLVEDLKRERDEYLELAQRARADFENYRKRAAREGADALLRGKTEVGKAVLPALDSLERRSRPTATAWPRVSLWFTRSLRPRLASAGIEPIDPAGESVRPQPARGALLAPARGRRGIGRGRRDRAARLPPRRNADPSRAGRRDELGGRRWRVTSTKSSGSTARPPTTRSRRHTARSRARTTPTATPGTRPPRSGSRRSRAPTTRSRTRRSARRMTRAAASTRATWRAASRRTSATSSRRSSTAAGAAAGPRPCRAATCAPRSR